MTKFIEQRVDELENQVAKLELIIHELRGKKSIEPSTTNTVEDIIEFEGKQYRKVDREAKPGDVVIFRNNNTRFFTNGKPYKVAFNGCPIDNESEAALPLYSSRLGRTSETVDIYELIKEGFNPQIPIVDETIEPLSPNQQRAEIIEKARQFIDATASDDTHFEIQGNQVLAWRIIRKGTGYDALTGVAVCSPNDVFNEDIGRAIAVGRMEGLVVSEFEQAVQPTEIVNGAIYESVYIDGTINYREEANVGLNFEYVNEKLEHGRRGTFNSTNHNARIINDTNAIYEV